MVNRGRQHLDQPWTRSYAAGHQDHRESPPAHLLHPHCTGVITRSTGIRFLWGDVIALGIYATVVMTLAAITFRKRLN